MRAEDLDTLGLLCGMVGGAMLGIIGGWKLLFFTILAIVLVWTGGYLTGRASER